MIPWKNWVVGNPLTKLMALFLAVLMWIYLDSEATAGKEFPAAFQPTLPPEWQGRLHVRYRGAEDSTRPLLPSRSLLAVQITGPRGEVDSLVRKRLIFDPRFDPAAFSERAGSFSYAPGPQDFELPPHFRVETTPARIQVLFEPYEEREVTVALSREDVVGLPARGYEVREIRSLPPRIRVRVPSSLGEKIQEVGILKPSIDNLASGTWPFPGQIDRSRFPDFDLQPAPGQSFVIHVTIEPIPFRRRFAAVPLHMEGHPEILRRIRLETTSVDVDIEGPRHLVESLNEQKDFHVFVPVPLELSDLPAAGDRRTERNIRYYFLDPNLRAALKVTILPDAEPQKREATYVVLPEQKP